MRARHITLGFALFTALVIFLALRLAKSTPIWLIAGAILLGVLIVGKVGFTLFSLEQRRMQVVQERRTRRTKARVRSKVRRSQ